jgi:enoyl-CoA hydratase
MYFISAFFYLCASHNLNLNLNQTEIIMEYKILKIAEQDGIAIVTISRPEAMNALNTAFYTEMNMFLDDISKRNDLKVVVLTGDGKAFVAGADIAEMVDMNQEQGYSFSKLGQNTFDRIENLKIPVIGAINGFCLGGGNELAMSCDFRIASNKAKFGQPEVNLGLTPGYAGTQRLARLVGSGNALMILLTADMITAEDALRMGLVQKVTEPENLMSEVMALAVKIAAKGPLAIQKVKKATRLGLTMSFAEGCNLEAKEFSSLFGNEGREGMQAFLEKRKPNW